MPESIREKARYYRRRAEALGPVRFVEAPAGDSLARWLDILFCLHAKRWATRQEAGVLSTPDVREFTARAVSGLAGVGMASVHGLCIGDRPAAAMLVLDDPLAAYYYISGFEPELRRISPGTMLLAHTIDRARSMHRAEMDFLRGAEPYKYRFGAMDRWSRARRFVGSRPSSFAADTSRSETEAPVTPNPQSS